MRNATSALISLIVVASAGMLSDSAAQESDKALSARARFAQLKGLAGEWTGKAFHGDDAGIDVTVTYRLTSAGSTVMETLFPGTGHEMVTMYHLDGDDLVLTHYCAAGNQPRMRAEPGRDTKKLVFKFQGGSNLKPDKDLHMHDAHFEFVADDHLKSEWVSYQDGKPAATAKFDLKRKK